MYLGIDFLIDQDRRPLVVDVNVGLPGGAQEYDLAFRVCKGRPSGVFEEIESISRAATGLPFAGYLGSLPFLPALKQFKLWMDGEGPLPPVIPEALRLEDKWVQYRILGERVPMPATMPFEPGDLEAARAFLARFGRLAVKRRAGRGGRGFRSLRDIGALEELQAIPEPLLLQEFVDSRVDGYTLSLRAVAFSGRFVCAYANLSDRDVSNHGTLAFVEPGNRFALSEVPFDAESFRELSWEARIWFGAEFPAYLTHNLTEERVARASLILPADLWEDIRRRSVEIERIYESLKAEDLPPAFFG